MHTTASYSRCGVKFIHVPRQNSQTLSIATITALAELVRKHTISGINIWLEHDEEEGITTYYCEAGHRKFQSTELEYAILEANGQMPSKICRGTCGQNKSINAYPRDQKSEDGRSNVCNVCNRRRSKIAFQRKRRA